MKKNLALIKVSLDSMFSLQFFFENFKKGKKQVAKNIGIIILFLYVVAVLAGMLLLVMVTMYNGLKPAGLQGLVLIQTGFIACAVTFIFGFFNAVSTYIIGAADEPVLAMPITNRQLFFSKYALTWLTELPLIALIITIGAGVYGWNEGLLLSPVFYLGTLAAVLALPVIPLTLAYIILVLLLNAGSFFRRKSVLLVLVTIIAVFLSLAMSLLFQNTMVQADDPAAFLRLAAEGKFDILKQAASAYPPVGWFYSAAVADSIIVRLLSVLFQLVCCGAVAAAAVLLLSPLYVRSLIGFNETVIKKLSDAGSYIRTDIRSRSVFTAFFKRDVLTILREPVFFMNGPMIILLLPALYAIIIFGNDNLRIFFQEMFSSIVNFDYVAAASVGAIGALLGSMTSIGASAFSREGCEFSYLMSMPVKIKTLTAAKFAHASMYTLIVSLMAFGASFFILKEKSAAVIVFLLSAVFASIVQIIGLWIDTAHPHLNWDNPAVAIKRNINVIASVLSGMLTIGIFAVVCIAAPHTMLTLWIVFAVCACIAAVLWFAYQHYAVRHLSRMDF